MASQRPISDSFHRSGDPMSSTAGVPSTTAVAGTGLPHHAFGHMGPMRPTSEVYGGHAHLSGTAHATPRLSDTDVFDRWAEDLNQFERTMEDMATASLEPSFKEELNAIEQWFMVLSEAERTASLYSLLQMSSPVQVRFFMAILQKMAKDADPMNALFLDQSAGVGGDVGGKGRRGLDRHSVNLTSTDHGLAAAHTRMSASSANLVEMTKNLRLNPAVSIPNSASAASFYAAGNRNLGGGNSTGSTAANDAAEASGAFNNRWSLNSLNGGGSAAGAPGSRPTSLTGSGGSDSLSLSMWRRSGTNPDGASGESKANSFLRPDRPGSALGGSELGSLASHSWGFGSSSNLTGLTNGDSTSGLNQPPIERPKSATDLDLADWRAVNHRPGRQLATNEPEIKSSLRQPLRTGGEGGLGPASSGGAPPAQPPHHHGHLGPAAPPSPFEAKANALAGGSSSLASRRLGAHKFSVAVYDGPEGSAAAAGAAGLKSPLKSPMFATGMKGGPAGNGARSTASRPTTPALPPGFYHHPPQSPWGTTSQSGDGSGPPGGPNATGVYKPSHPAGGLRHPSQQPPSQQPMGIPTTDGFVHYPSSSLNRLNSPVRSKFGFNTGPAASTHHHHHHHVHHQPHGTGYPYGHGGNGSGGAGPTHGSPNMGAAHLPGVYGMAKSRGPGSTTSLVSSTSAAVGAGGPVDPSDPSLLEDIPAWLRSLRLHKYTPCFENMHWKDVVDLTDEELTAKGVAALGARRKMLKVFETVRQGMEDKGLLPPKANGGRGGNQVKATAGEGEDDDNDDAEDGSGPDKEGSVSNGNSGSASGSVHQSPQPPPAGEAALQS